MRDCLNTNWMSDRHGGLNKSVQTVSTALWSRPAAWTEQQCGGRSCWVRHQGSVRKSLLFMWSLSVVARNSDRHRSEWVGLIISESDVNRIHIQWPSENTSLSWAVKMKRKDVRLRATYSAAVHCLSWANFLWLLGAGVFCSNKITDFQSVKCAFI